jgi:hypothetical protein
MRALLVLGFLGCALQANESVDVRNRRLVVRPPGDGTNVEIRVEATGDDQLFVVTSSSHVALLDRTFATVWQTSDVVGKPDDIDVVTVRDGSLRVRRPR